MGRTLVTAGLLILALGLLIMLGERLPFRLGRLPGDIVIKGKHGAFYFPIMICLLVSVLVSLVMWVIGRR